MILEDKLEREAVARIFSDLIEADFIVEDSEMKCFEEIISPAKFKISNETLIESKSRTFAWAINKLKAVKPQDKETIKKELYNLALYDGVCVPLEALQIMAITFALDGKAEVFSIPSNNNYADGMNILYIENEDNTEQDEYIKNHYRSISLEFQAAGFQFVYIPKIVEDYKKMPSKYLRKVISYMIPSWNEDKVAAMQKELCSMTTRRFCHELLYGKMGLQVLGTKPALLIKIGESFVSTSLGKDDNERVAYSNFLKVDLEGDILSQVISIVDTFRKMVSGKTTIEIQPATSKFIYTKFHKSLFDLIAFGKRRTNYRIVINLLDCKHIITFIPLDGNSKPIVHKDLTGKLATLYILMIHQSVFGKGLDWRENINSEDKGKIMLKYHDIYMRLSSREWPDEYKDMKVISKVKKAIRSLEPDIANIDLFLPDQISKGKESIYNVPVPPDLVHVIDNNKEIRMDESHFWQNLGAEIIPS